MNYKKMNIEICKIMKMETGQYISNDHPYMDVFIEYCIHKDYYNIVILWKKITGCDITIEKIQSNEYIMSLQKQNNLEFLNDMSTEIMYLLTNY